MGVTELKTLYGRPIKVYDKERTISIEASVMGLWMALGINSEGN